MDPSLVQRVNDVRLRIARGIGAAAIAELEALEAQLDAAGAPPALRRRLADLWAGQERWVEAARVLAPLAGSDLRTERRLNLARNLAALAEARPELYAELRALAPVSPPPYEIDARLRVCVRSDDGAYLPLVADPVARAEAQWSGALDMVRRFGPVALIGVGDGYLLAALSDTDFDLPNGMAQPVVIIEPDLQLVRTVLELHDLSGPAGVIRDPRGRWCVGPSWERALRGDLLERAELPLPQSFLIGWASQETQARVLALVEAYQAENLAVQARNELRDRGRGDLELLRLLGDRPPRRPRILLITSDFTRVLRHATRSLAETFAGLGWEPRVLSEGAPWKRLPRLALRRAVADFDPDMALIINHARVEYGSAFPAQLPFVTWVQDQMPNLERAEVGRSMGPRDFVMSGMDALVDSYEYPAEQVLRMRCLARPRAPAPIPHTTPHHDLVYVSHCSLDRSAMVRQAQARVTAQDLDPARARAALAAVFAVYDRGGALPTSRAVAECLAQAIALDVEDPLEWARWVGLCSMANIALYRQQALGWAVQVARARGLDLAIYGQGWELRPEFRAHARGPVAYGEALDALQRAATFNLVLEPFPVSSHWRGLDILAAGAMPLVRAHPYPHALAGLARCLDRITPEGRAMPGDTAAARVMVAGRPERAELEGWLEGCAYLGLLGDPVCFAAQLRAEGGADLDVPPGIGAVSFDGPASLERALDRFDAPAERAAAIAPMKAFVERHLSYEAGVRHLIARVRSGIASTSAEDLEGDTAGRAA